MAATVTGIALAVVAVGVLIGVQRAHAQRVAAERRALLADAVPLLDDASISQHGIGYPTLNGADRGHRVTIQLVVDSLTLRRLPRLWLVVSVFRPTGLAGPVDILRDAQVPAMVTPSDRFRHVHPTPAEWPGEVRVASPGPSPPDLRPFDAAAAVLGEPETKGILAGPGGVRIVQELARGDRAHWRVVRRVKFDVDPLPAGRVARLMHAAQQVAAHEPAPTV
ncbi:MAG: hypothetical protein QOJ21_115 [Solirubrobacteraceae bacterium]|nr:hypothetical protein [Solirubrobacteraceae bacterium]